MSEAKISCRNVWKLFGSDPEKFLAAHGGVPDTEALTAGGYIPAVRDATVDVHEGEILVLMGLSGSGKSTLREDTARVRISATKHPRCALYLR